MIEQGSPEWLAQRAGSATCSRFKDVLARVKSGEAASRRNYRLLLAAERLIGAPINGYQNQAMAHGTAMEPRARERYECETGVIVEQTGFLKHPEIEWCGGSPDGLVDDDGIIEIKSPYVPTVHFETLIDGMPNEHMAQCQGLMLVTGRSYVDFISYDERFPEHLQLYVQRIKRNEEYIDNLRKELLSFLKETQALCDRLMNKSTLLDKLVASLPANSLASQP